MREQVDLLHNFHYTLHDHFPVERGTFSLCVLMERNLHKGWFAVRAALPGELGPTSRKFGPHPVRGFRDFAFCVL